MKTFEIALQGDVVNFWDIPIPSFFRYNFGRMIMEKHVLLQFCIQLQRLTSEFYFVLENGPEVSNPQRF